ncbi:anti-repressor SinI family protein [Bacillus zhangzhouensis]|uniref:anti-repressor SinI family protein n=1 Tax=Bacillus zhangzhouensis TaxID=1178540 RepID=UPI00098EC7AB|nr:anti-repressor SinI family protein [Bacillus zhangzhouensis]
MEKKTKVLDSEWVQLLCEARKAGLTVEEVRHFLKSSEKSSESPPMVRSHSIKPF